MNGPWSKKGLAVGFGLASLAVTSCGLAADNDALQARVSELEQQVKQLLAKQGVVEEDLGKMVIVDGKGFKNRSTGTTFSYGGYAKSDVLVSDYSDGSQATSSLGDDFLVASTIPVGGEDGDVKYDMHAKSSRFFFETATMTEVGRMGSHLEFDFHASGQGDERISNSYATRLRHAFLTLDRPDGSQWLAGQTWSTFFNVGTCPELLDFVGPIGIIFERQPQLRYTRGGIQFAIENPSTGLYGEAGSEFGGGNNFDNNSWPDLVARFNRKSGDFSYSLAGMVREIAYEEGGSDDEAVGAALALAGKWSLGEDDIRFQLNYGNLGRYMGLQTYRDGVIETDGDIDLTEQLGGYIAYRHVWGEGWRSSLVLAASEADNPDTVSESTPESYISVHANLLYSPTAKLTVGGELIYAEKSIEGEINGADSGELTRFQFSTKYTF